MVVRVLSSARVGDDPLGDDENETLFFLVPLEDEPEERLGTLTLGWSILSRLLLLLCMSLTIG